MADSKSKSTNELMACMEVWGGNGAVEKHVEMLGLDSWVYSKPFEGSDFGGDVYYLSSCATGRIIRLLVADVSGHGSMVKEPAIKLRHFMRQYINQISQKRFVKAMNQSLLSFSKGGLFATAVVASYFAPTRSLTITNAGHPPPIYFDHKIHQWRALALSAVSDSNPTDIPLGVLKMSDYKSQNMRLNPKDIVILYSDALIECRNANGEELEVQGLCDLLNQIGDIEPQQLITTVLNKLQKLYPNNLQNDDVTLMAFSPNNAFEEQYQTPSLFQHMKIMGKIFGKIFSKGKPIPWPDLHPANMGGAMFRFMNKLWGRNFK